MSGHSTVDQCRQGKKGGFVSCLPARPPASPFARITSGQVPRQARLIIPTRLTGLNNPPRRYGGYMYARYVCMYVYRWFERRASSARES